MIELGRDIDILLPDPDSQLERYLADRLPVELCALFPEHPYRAAGVHRPRNSYREIGQWDPATDTHGSIYPCQMADELAGFPVWPWAHRPPRWEPNSLWFPTGSSRHAIGLFWLAIDQLAPHFGKQFSLTFATNSSVWSLELHLLKTIRVSPTLALAVFVDLRYTQAGTVVDIAEPDDWGTILSSVNVPNSGFSTPAVPPDRYLWNRQLPVGLVLDGLAACAGQRIVYSPTDGYLFRSLSGVGLQLQQRAAALPVVAGAYTVIDDTVQDVGYVSVSLPAANLRYLEMPGKRIVFNRQGYGATNSTVYASQPVRSVGGYIQNQTEIDAVVDHVYGVVRNYYRLQPSYYLSLPPDVFWEPTAGDDAVWIMFGPQQRDGRYTPRTLVSSLPRECWPVEYPISHGAGESDPPKHPVRWFEATADLFPPTASLSVEDAEGNPATVNLFADDGAGTTPRPLGVARQGITGHAGTQVWGQHNQKRSRWDVIAGQFSRILFGIVGGALIPFDSHGSVTVWWPKLDTGVFESSGEAVDAWNFMYPDIPAGARVSLAFDPTANQWLILSVAPDAGKQNQQIVADITLDEDGHVTDHVEGTVHLPWWSDKVNVP